MAWLRKIERRARGRCRPNLEGLETRALLSVGNPSVQVGPLSTSPVPAQGNLASSSSASFDAITGASQARASYGVDGTGLAAAVIDMGVNYRHEALGGGIGAGFKVEAGYDFVGQTNDPNATSFEHGTAVAGLIASDDPAHPGVAPGADLVPLKVFGNDQQGDFNWIANALQWVIDNHGKYNISVVNLSISDENNYTLNWYAQDGGVGERVTSLIHQLDDLNIPVVTAAGNKFNGQQGMGFAAIVGDTISVTATNASDHLASDSQRLGSAVGGDLVTDIAAPGVGLLAPADGNNFATVEGTSFSAAVTSGAVILLQQIYQKRFGTLPTVAQVDGWLKAGADPIADPATGITIGRLNIPKAASLIPSPPSTSTPPPVTVPPTTVPSSDSQPTPPATQVAVPPAPVQPTTQTSTGIQWTTYTPTPLPVAPATPPPQTQPTTSATTVSAPTAPPATTSKVTTRQAEVVLNGQSQGTVSLDDTTNSWSLYLSSFPLPKSLARVQIWTRAGSEAISNLPSHSAGKLEFFDNNASRPRKDGVVRPSRQTSKLPATSVSAAPSKAPSIKAPSTARLAKNGNGSANQGGHRPSVPGLSHRVAAVRIRT